MKDYNYYKEELERINIDSEYPMSFKIFNDEGNTKQMNLNLESIDELIIFLNDLKNRIEFKEGTK